MERKLHMNIDFSYIFRKLKENLFWIIVLAVITGSLSFVVADKYVPVSYTSTVNMTMLNTSGSTSAYTRKSILNALSQFKSALHNENLSEAVKTTLGCEELPGTITIDYYYDTNILYATCTASTKTDALRMARAVRKSYKSVSALVNNGYILFAIGNDDVSTIQKSGINSLLITGYLTLLVVLIYSSVIILICLFDGKLQSVEQAQRELDTLILGVLPYEKHLNKQEFNDLNNMKVSLRYSRFLKMTVTSSIREIQNRDMHTVMITSMHPSEGKSTFSISLASELAKRGEKVLLIDADFLKPSFYRFTDSKDNIDFIEFLTNTDKMNKALKTQKINGLYYLASDNCYETADQMLEVMKLEIFFEKLRRFFSYIIIDVPPARVGRIYEVLSPYSDGTIMVARMEKTKINTITELVDDIDNYHSPTIGMVLNRSKDKTAWMDYTDYSYGETI